MDKEFIKQIEDKIQEYKGKDFSLRKQMNTENDIRMLLQIFLDKIEELEIRIKKLEK